MALVKFYSDTQAKIASHAIENGALYVATDSGKMYVDINGARHEIGETQPVSWGDIQGKPNNLATTSDVTGAVAAEASARQKQDGLLEDAIDAKLGADDMVAGNNISISHDEASGHVTISGTYTLSSFGVTATADELNYVDGVTSNIQEQLNDKADIDHEHSASDITSGTLGTARGGTGINSNPSMLTNLSSVTPVNVFQSTPRPGVTGTLAITNGGTGATTASAARANLDAAADDVILIQNSQPSSSTCKIWIQP